ncbi:hypothetical protein PILCRDRAFT_16037 [Piloderma croceum F 1598]|uniref:Peptidase C14 caspase domain-containing protein n=1 Tax=Piloderma croceum (strain F 1598) TaxID=765440 RepID=A0A0C3EIT8_PILCF|nr:hypothetical protein PILCRDRAFT_16037 [Piloderma croceum F 1598]
MEFMPDETDGMHDEEQHNRLPQGDTVTKKMTATIPPKERTHNRTPHSERRLPQDDDEMQYFRHISVRHEHQKKALLIGISYEENEEDGTLEGPHTGILELRMMLIKQYGYADRNIVVMLDSQQVPVKLRPTHNNILEQIDIMVHGAQAGDHFFFAFSGHSGQVTNSEEDGQDELIIANDGKDLVDNVLKAHLVDPLPVGSSLVAFLDTCHSGSLLDLTHHQCNRVYTPRISKGYRKTDFHWNANVRRDAVNETAAFHHDSTNVHKTVSTMIVESPSPPEFPIARSAKETRSKGIRTPEAAHVICISVCTDVQRAWEGTSIIPDTHPLLCDLMVRLTHQTHEQCLDIHEFTPQYKRGPHSNSFYGEMVNFQDPQVASHMPLNMDERFEL